MLQLIIFVSLIMFIIQGIPLIKKRLWKELGTVIFLLVIVILLGIIKELHMYTPIDVLEYFIYPLGKAVFR